MKESVDPAVGPLTKEADHGWKRNDEPVGALNEVETPSDLFRELYELAPVGYFSISRHGFIRRVNTTGARMLGKECGHVLGRSFAEFTTPETRGAAERFVAGIFADEDPGPCEVSFVRDAGMDVIAILRGVISLNRGLCRVAATDITLQRRAEMEVRAKSEDLSRSEDKFRNLFESSPTAVHLYQLGGAGRLILLDVNAASCREFGKDQRGLIGKPLEEVFPCFAGTAVVEMCRAVAKGELGNQSFDHHHGDCGKEVVFEVNVFRTNEGTIAMLFSNISERAKVREALERSRIELEEHVLQRTAQLQDRTRQLRALADELTHAEERERRRIAGVIHEDLQQMLVAALLNVGILKNKATDEESIAEFTRIEGILRASVQTARSLTAEMSSPFLHQCGLAAGLKWLQAWCAEKYGLDVRVDLEEGVEPSAEAGVSAFHCVRELLFNVVKHAGVREAGLRMWRAGDDFLKIEVSDKGCGFDLNEVRAREGSAGGFGLFHSRERLEWLGGRLEIESAPGAGSRFTLSIPLDANDGNDHGASAVTKPGKTGADLTAIVQS